MKNLFRAFGVILLLLVFLAGSTGVSFYIHECHSSNTKEVFLFPEILKHNISCGCGGEEHEKPVASSPLHYNEPDCCKNSHLYIKASFQCFPLIQKQKSERSFQIYPFHLFSLLLDESKGERIKIAIFQDHAPPPLAGRMLILTIHQIKIPVSFS